MKIIKRAFGEFHKFHMKQFCLSYDPLKWDFIAFGMNIISIRKCIVDADVVNDAQFTVKTLNIGTPRPATVVVLNIKPFNFTMK